MMPFWWLAAAVLLPSSAHAMSYGGQVDGVWLGLDLPVDVVQSMLPKGLEIAPAHSSLGSTQQKATHSVFLTFCIQKHVGQPFTDFNYDEFILNVPSVQWDDDHAPLYPLYRGPFSYLPHLYLNESLPVELGRLWVGDNKELGNITKRWEEEAKSGTTESQFNVSGATSHPFAGKPIVSATWLSNSSWGKPIDFPSFSGDAFQIPSIGRYPQESGAWKCLPQQFALSDAKILPVTATAHIEEQFSGQIPVGTSQFAALSPARMGAFRLQAAWKYTSLSSNCKDFNPSAPNASGICGKGSPQAPTEALSYTDPCTPNATTVCNYQNSVGCTGRMLSEPTSEDELRAGVLKARSQGLRLRAIGRPHSDNLVWCDPAAAMFSMHKLNNITSLDKDAMTVTVEGGTLITQVNDWLHQHNLTLAALYPAYSDLTVAGVLGTGAHGSSLSFPSALSSALFSVEVMNSTGDVNVHAAGSESLRALQTHLGTLGIVLRVTLKVTHQYKLQVEQTVITDPRSFLLNGSMVQALQQHFWSYVGWYPHLGEGVLRTGTVVDSSTAGNASTDFLIAPFPKIFVPFFSALNQFAVEHPECSCDLEHLSMNTEKDSPPWVEGGHSVNPAVGFSHLILSGVCAPGQCAWDNGLRVEEMEIAVPFRRAQEALDFLVTFFNTTGAKLCFPLQGIWFRGAKGDDGLLSMGAQGEDRLVIGLTSWRPNLGQPRYHEQAYAVLANELIETFQGRPHWAKNTPSTFQGRNWTNSFGPGWKRFKQQRALMDPEDAFMNDFAKTLFDR